MGAKPRKSEREIVVRIRRRPEKPPWHARRAVSWSLATVAGDPALLLVPAFSLAVFLLAALALGAPGRAEVVVPMIVPPPADSFQDIGIVALAGKEGAGEWILRACFAAARAALFALIAALAVQCARGRAASVPEARRSIAKRVRTIGVLGALSFGYALLVSQQSFLDPQRDAAVAATALAAGMLVLPGAFVAAVAFDAGVFRSLRHGLAFPKPAGHVVVVLAYAAAVNGLYRLASFGEPARGRALPLTLYGLVTALLTAVFVCVLARRYVLLRGTAPGGAVKPAMSGKTTRS